MHRLHRTSHIFLRTLTLVSLVLFVVFSLISIASLNNRAGATSSTFINFQARMLQASGAVVADGSYNVRFDLYYASGGGSIWNETYLVSDVPHGAGVATKNGYMTVSLGTVTPLPTINWDQQLTLGMTIRGTTSCAWGSCAPTDSEMTPRMPVTAIPYAFSAGQLQVTEATNTYTSKLQLTTPSGSSKTITVPDANGTVCLSTANCNGASGGMAPNSASYLTLGLDSNLSAERLLSPGASLTVSDGGANGNYAIDTVQDIRTSATPGFGGLTLTSNLALNGGNITDNVGASTLTLQANSANEVSLSSTAFYPAASGGNALGVATTNMWSDLFLANGGTINWNNGEVVITHTGANALRIGDGTTDLVTMEFAAGQVDYNDIIASNGPADEQCLTYNSTGPTFTWANCVTGTYDNYVSWTARDGGATTYTQTSLDNLQITDGTGIDSNFTAGTTLTLSVIADSIGDTQLTYNTGQNLTTADNPGFGGLTLTSNLALNGGNITDNVGASTLTLQANSANEVSLSSTAFYPAASGGNALGVATTNMWSDLFLANGGTINWNNGEVVITHTGANALRIGDGTTDLVTMEFAAGQVDYNDIIASNGPADEQCLTYNSTGPTFTWANCVTGTYDNYVSWTARDGGATTYTQTSLDNLQITDGTGIDSNFTAGTTLTLSVIADSIGDTQLTYNTGQNLTTADNPGFGGLTLTSNLALNGGNITDNVGASTLTLQANSANEVSLSSTAFYPAASGGNALGVATTNMWSDLFLANGGTINWNNGEVVITHTGANALRIGDGTTDLVTMEFAAGQVDYNDIIASNGPADEQCLTYNSTGPTFTWANCVTGTYDNYVSWTARDGGATTYTQTSLDNLQITDGTGIDSNFTAGTTLTLSVIADSIGDTQLTYNTGQNLTTADNPGFGGLTLTSNLALNGGNITDNVGASTLTLQANSANEVSLSSTAFYPAASGGNALGVATTNMWSDLFLANGGTINWNNGEVVITHTGANALRIGDGTTDLVTMEFAAGQVDYNDIIASNGPADEQCLTYNSTGPTFTWAACGSLPVSSLNSATGAITIQGTANEVDVTTPGPTITVGLPNDVTVTNDLRADNFLINAASDINDSLFSSDDTSRYIWTPVSGWGEYWDTSTDRVSWYGSSASVAYVQLTNGDANFAGTVTATLDCTNCIDSGAIAASAVGSAEIVDGSILPVELNVDNAAVDEYCLTYSSGTTHFVWAPCGAPAYITASNGTPDLKADTTDPGGTLTMRCTTVGKTGFIHFDFAFSSKGTGNYYLYLGSDCPTPSSNYNRYSTLGGCNGRDASTRHFPCSVTWDATNSKIRFTSYGWYTYIRDTNNINEGGSAAWTIASGDSLTGDMVYETD